jgi:hypothetical protein
MMAVCYGVAVRRRSSDDDGGDRLCRPGKSIQRTKIDRKAMEICRRSQQNCAEPCKNTVCVCGMEKRMWKMACGGRRRKLLLVAREGVAKV